MSLPFSKRPRPRIAIAGASGRVGASVTASLMTDPVDLVALTRTPDAARFPLQVMQAAVDFDQPATLAQALRDVDRLFLAQGTSPRQVENEIALIDAAEAAGVRHIVKLSSFIGPMRYHPFDWHARIEAHLASRDMGFTMLRPTTFMNVLVRSGQAVVAGDWGGAAGEGVVNLIDARDVADAARAALLDAASTNWQRAFHLTGPRAWSMPEVAEALSRLLGRDVAYRQRSSAEQRQYLLSSGLGEFAAGVLVGLDEVTYQSALRETTTTVQLLTGHAPRTLPDWLAENIALFGGRPTA